MTNKQTETSDLSDLEAALQASLDGMTELPAASPTTPVPAVTRATRATRQSPVVAAAAQWESVTGKALSLDTLNEAVQWMTANVGGLPKLPWTKRLAQAIARAGGVADFTSADRSEKERLRHTRQFAASN